MSRPRVSIAGLMAVVLVCALGVAALKAATPIWTSAVFTTTVALLGLAILGAIFRTGPKRAFWTGFAILGWGYLTLAFGPWFTERIEPLLLTSEALNAAHARIHPGPEVTSAVISASPSTPASTVLQARNLMLTQGTQRINVTTQNPPGGGGMPLSISLATVATTSANREEFRYIGHALFALIAGLMGGLAARYFARRPDPPSEVAL